MAKVPNAVEILPKIWTAWVGHTNVTDDRKTTDIQTTDGRAIAYRRSLKMLPMSKSRVLFLRYGVGHVLWGSEWVSEWARINVSLNIQWVASAGHNGRLRLTAATTVDRNHDRQQAETNMVTQHAALDGPVVQWLERWTSVSISHYWNHVTCAHRFTCKHIVHNTCSISLGMGVSFAFFLHFDNFFRQNKVCSQKTNKHLTDLANIHRGQNVGAHQWLHSIHNNVL